MGDAPLMLRITYEAVLGIPLGLIWIVIGLGFALCWLHEECNPPRPKVRSRKMRDPGAEEPSGTPAPRSKARE
jgi:hypothetical protein